MWPSLISVHVSCQSVTGYQFVLEALAKILINGGAPPTSYVSMIVAKYVSFPECEQFSGSPRTLPMAAAVFVVSTIATYALF